MDLRQGFLPLLEHHPLNLPNPEQVLLLVTVNPKNPLLLELTPLVAFSVQCQRFLLEILWNLLPRLAGSPHFHLLSFVQKRLSHLAGREGFALDAAEAAEG